MAKYMYRVKYSAEGVRGILKDGGSARRQAVEQVTANLGGKVEAFYFAFGADDGFLIVDLPDNASAAAAPLLTGASGAVSVETTVLLTPEEIDQAAEKARRVQPQYRPPGA